MIKQIKICSMNVRGLAENKKRFDVFSWLKKKKFSIYCLQDIHVSECNELNFKQDWGSEVILHGFTTESRGVAILFGDNISYKIINIEKDRHGNLLIVNIEINDQELILMVLYGPNKDNPLFYNHIKEVLALKENLPTIICGDWNLVLDFKMDTFGYIRENNINARRKVEELIDIFDLVDTWRSSNPQVRKYSWTSSKRPVQMSRLDFFLVTTDIHAKVTNHILQHGYRSDHSFIGIEINVEETARGKGFWKFNTSFLQDINYIIMIKEEIKNTLLDYTVQTDNNSVLSQPKFIVSNQMLYEMIKLRIRGKTIPYCAHKKKLLLVEENNLEKKIEHTENELMGRSNTPNQIIYLKSKLDQCKEELKILRQPKLYAIMMRAKAKIYEESEKPTSYFCNLEKRNYINKLISRINTGNKMLTDQKSILNELKKFYKNLYDSKHNPSDLEHISTFLKKENIKPLKPEDKVKCEGLISEIEIKSVLKNMQNGKSPGSDGYPAEFYKFFWRDIGQYVLNSINEAMDKGELSFTQKQAVITLLPKGNKPREFIKNWRPISLLNVDYKLLSGVLANRLKNVLPTIISNEQKGFLKSRYIGENIRTIYDVMEYLQQNNKAGMLLLIDFEKAFDSLEWFYLNKVLKAYNFGEQFISWFNILYKNSSSCVINNGMFSEFFQLGRSCRQGDPLSPYLFILAIEPLAEEIKQNSKIKGLQFQATNIKIGQYADDTFLLLDGSEMSLRESLLVLKKFEFCSGLKVNVDKTQVVWLGSSRNNPEICEDLNLKWVQQFVLLGITFNTNLPDIINLNFTPKVHEIEKLLLAYKKWKLSILGKITVLKMMAIPKLVYLLTVLPSPGAKFFSYVEGLFKDFIWDGSVKITLSQLEQDISQGGLKLTNLRLFHSALKLSWIKRLIATTGSWQKLFEVNVRQAKDLFWELDIQSLKVKHITNVFWKELINLWIEYKLDYIEDIDRRCYPLWGTYFLKSQNLMVKRDEFEQRGITHINDLLTNTGDFYGYQEFIEFYGINLNFLDFYTFMHSIPRNWKAIYQGKLESHDVKQGVLVSLLKMKKVCKETYTKFLEDKTCCRPHTTKWSNILNKSIEASDWEAIYSVNFKCTIESKMRSFQYRLLLRIIPTNKFLFRCNMSHTDRCYYCGIECETIEHLFWFCPIVKNFWFQVSEQFNQYLDLKMFLNAKSVLLGYLGDYNSSLVNHIFNIIKRYIYLTKCKECMLSSESLFKILRHVYHLEKIIVEHSGKLQFFLDKWDPVHPLLD